MNVNELPDHMRHPPGLYPYLATMPDYWRHALEVAHCLLDRHEVTKQNATYYQDNFGDDFIAALEFDDICRPLVVTSVHELDSRLGGSERKEDSAWCAYNAAIEDLRTRPRGAQLLVHMSYEGGQHWEARINTGAGHIDGCSTMRRFQQQPGPDEAVKTLLRYEAYLARQHAQKERLVVANHRRIRELGLAPGLQLRNVNLLHKGRIRQFSFEILEIYETGTLKLGNGKLRGSRNSFGVSKDAAEIGANNLTAASTAALFR